MPMADSIEGAPAAADRLLRRAGLVLFGLAAQFMTVIMLAASIARGYDYNGAAISDLGVIESTAWLLNGSLIAVGVLNLLGGYLLYRAHGKVWCLAIFVVAGIGAVGAGVFPLDRGGMHSLSALVAFLFFNVEAIAVGTLLRGWLRPISFLAGAVGLVFVVLMAMGDSGTEAAFGAIGHGGTERMIVYPVMQVAAARRPEGRLRRPGADRPRAWLPGDLPAALAFAPGTRPGRRRRRAGGSPACARRRGIVGNRARTVPAGTLEGRTP